MARRAPGSGTVFQRADRPGWWMEWTDRAGVRRRRRSKAETLTRAQKELADFLAAESAAEQPRDVRATLAQLLADYAPIYAAQVSPASFERAVPSFRRAGEWFGARPVAEIRRLHVQEYVEHLRAEGLSEQTVRRDLAVLGPVFDEAVEDGLLQRSPLRGPRHRRVRIEPYRPRQVTPLTSAQEESLLAQLAEKYRPVVVVLMDTGMRLAQALALEWQHVAQDLSSVSTPFPQKGGRAAEVPCTLRLRDLFARLLERRASRPMRGPWQVFPDVTRSGLQQHWRRARGKRMADGTMTRAGLPGLRLHDLRHLYADRLKASGASPRVVASLLGHRSERMVSEVYATQAGAEELRAAVARLDPAPGHPEEEPGTDPSG